MQRQVGRPSLAAHRKAGTEARPTGRLILSEETAPAGRRFLWVSPGDKI